jgi:HK97 family phage portal protein
VGFLQTLRSGVAGFLPEFRSSLENPSTPLSYPAEWLLDIFNGGRTDAGIRVSELTALQVSTCYACVDLISGAMASIDLNVYEQLEPRGKRLAFEQDLHFILHDEPNIEMTAFTFIRTFMAHALLWSNGYAEIERDQANRVIALWPRSPVATRPRRTVEPITIDGERIPIGTLIYETTDGQIGEQNKPQHPRLILAENMLHVPGLSLDGRLGKPIIELTRQVFGLALATEKYGGKFFANGIRPTGVIEVPNAMEPVAIENFKRSVQEAYGGENMLRPMIIENGMKWTQSDLKPNEAQFLETRKHQREEIAAIFHVPVRMLGESGRVNRSSAEQEAIELVQYTLRPWIKAIQPELKRKLFVKKGRTAFQFFPAFYYQDMLTPDSESRAKLITVIKQWGIANSNDIREYLLDWNPILGPAGETYWMPVNMMDAAFPLRLTPGDPNSITGAEGGGDDDNNPDDEDPDKPKKPEAAPPEDQRDQQRFVRAHSRFFQDAMQRLLTREKPDIRDFRNCFTQVLSAMAELIAEAATLDFRMDGTYLTAEVQSFIQEYIQGMQKRSGDWKQDEVKATSSELVRAVKAVKVAVYRDLATGKAKQETSNLHEEEIQ